MPDSTADKSATADTVANTPTTQVRALLQIISRQRPMDEAIALLDDNVAAYMDNQKIGNGKTPWFQWVRFLHHTADIKKISPLTILIDQLEEKNDTVTVQARWQGEINGALQTSAAGLVTYQVKNQKIINIWTSRRNYTFIYGDAIADNRIAFYWLLGRLMLWNRIHSG